MRNVDGSGDVAGVLFVRSPNVEHERDPGGTPHGTQLRGPNFYYLVGLFVAGDARPS